MECPIRDGAITKNDMSFSLERYCRTLKKKKTSIYLSFVYLNFSEFILLLELILQKVSVPSDYYQFPTHCVDVPKIKQAQWC